MAGSREKLATNPQFGPCQFGSCIPSELSMKRQLPGNNSVRPFRGMAALNGTTATGVMASAVELRGEAAEPLLLHTLVTLGGKAPNGLLPKC